MLKGTSLSKLHTEMEEAVAGWPEEKVVKVAGG